MSDEPVDYPDPIIVGSDWDWKWLFADDEAVEESDWGFNWLADEWELTIELRDKNESLVATLANFGSPDGTITPQSDGLLLLHLPAAITAALTPTRVYTNSTDPRVSGWRHRGNYFFDLQAVNVTQAYTITPVSGSVTVQQNVTA